MEYIMIILIIIIILLCLYLFLIKKELRRITRILKDDKNKESNALINQETSSKEIKNIIFEINKLLKYTRENRILYEQRQEEIYKMMMNISHDLRTPLTSSLGYIDLINNSKLTSKEKDHALKVIEERLKRLEELINSFFEFSCIVSSNKPIELESINIISILEECIANYYDDYANENRAIIFVNRIKKYNVLSNADMLKRVFDNLITNAYKHSGDDLTIEVYKDDKLTIILKNKVLSGDLDVEHIFDEFYTVDISRTKGNTGLGLAIAKEFIEILGGSIRALKDNNNLVIKITI